MRARSFADMPCPIARSLDRVGEWWSILILREAFLGASRFDDFQRALPIAPTTLTRRLNGLVAAGLFERRGYSTRPVRHEYVLTEVGHDFRPVLIALLAWGNRHFAPEGAAVVVKDRATGRQVEPILVEAGTGHPITPRTHRIAAGPQAPDWLRARLGVGA
ncbi:transcriptional regulator [Luteitalea sp. TBR-22]|uniref:winged helix-turn-helix transcriptional regulator n=1 Tax=Luteitalea sp. TBR-22 TaxID=2802971 RepID=UPI001AF4DBD8|nr:helix-turn-helix domain-containing protein [Luteitalea sp. TBR-22]BCS33835.1 transcriptional regulator [Luteitalea sp. TBR-22]